jgi:hypothetical protein
MKTRVLILAAVVLMMLITACSYNIPIGATSNALGTKVGVYTQVGYLGFPPMMSKAAAVTEAAKNGGITKISTVNYNYTWLIFMTKYETIVTGE